MENEIKKDKKINYRVLRIVGIVLLAVILIAAIAVAVIYHYTFSEYQSQVIEVDTEKISISDQAPASDLFHVAVFGIDSYSDYVGRADSIMIFTVDMENKQLKLTSILRDSYVPIEGHGNDKINHAYAYGGAELMLSTINQNYNMNITEYVVLDFKDVATLIDAVGGLDLEITEEERASVNGIARGMGYNGAEISSAGFVHLSGLQVTAYARIRKIDDESARSGRQREVIQKLLDKLLERDIFEYPKLLHDFLPQLETTLSIGELTSAALDAAQCDWAIKECVIPDTADKPEGGLCDGAWYWKYDISAATDRWHKFLQEGATH